MAPSAARVVYDHYGADKFPGMKELLESVDRVDSADLEMEDVTDAKGGILLGFIMDPRTGLGRFRHFKISNYQLMMNMVDLIGQHSVEEILALPDVKERVDFYLKQNEEFKNSLPNFSKVGWKRGRLGHTEPGGGAYRKPLPGLHHVSPMQRQPLGFLGLQKAKRSSRNRIQYFQQDLPNRHRRTYERIWRRRTQSRRNLPARHGQGGCPNLRNRQ